MAQEVVVPGHPIQSATFPDARATAYIRLKRQLSERRRRPVRPEPGSVQCERPVEACGLSTDYPRRHDDGGITYDDTGTAG